ncbi:hypothetical protein DJ021_07880 [Phenylobacterium hankyongense]|uniref:Lipoprotein n=1 Tax=Phenylobacterium hankyongense TaxID=1813876 RepID=A0A328AYQ6_9CAUL|nr:hypothetical protein [Phenylobacterium hankyongense]RAK59727.1 hypothetical protein DJ021_07880 [Phenylobacterium hankyongense]
MAPRSTAALVALALAGLGATACTTTSQVHPEYVSAGLSAPVVQGKAVIVMDAAARNGTVTAHPTSLTGAATSITEPMGPIIAATGQKVFGAGFSGGAQVADQPQPDAYAVALRSDSFSFKYDQLSNLGFAITPKVSVGVTADVAAPGGKPLLHKSYTRTDITTGAYAASLNPPEKINQALHMALGEIWREVLDDIKAAAAKGAP